MTAAQQRELEDSLLREHGLDRGQVPDGFLRVAAIRVTSGGLALDAPELKALFKPFLHGVRRGSARRTFAPRGHAPDGMDLSERRLRTFVRGLCGFYRRLCAPRQGGPRVQVSRAQAAFVPLHPGDNERHPRSGELQLIRLPEAEDVALRVDVERAVTHGPVTERRRALPDELLGSPSTRRRMRRKQDARRALARQLGQPSSARFQDPGGMRPLPLHEGRMVARMLRDPRAKLKFLRSLPPAIRHQLHKAGRYRAASRLREPYADATMHITAWYAFLTFCAQSPRVRRAGYGRAVEGLCREALAAAFPPNPNSGAPFDANSLSNWTRVLEQFGLVLREQPNHASDVYRGPTGWALSVYRMPSADELQGLLTQLVGGDGRGRPLDAAPEPDT